MYIVQVRHGALLVMQQQEAAMMEETLENAMPIAMVLSEVPPSEAAVEQTEEVLAVFIVPPSPKAASPDPVSSLSIYFLVTVSHALIYVLILSFVDNLAKF